MSCKSPIHSGIKGIPLGSERKNLGLFFNPIDYLCLFTQRSREHHFEIGLSQRAGAVDPMEFRNTKNRQLAEIVSTNQLPH